MKQRVSLYAIGIAATGLVWFLMLFAPLSSAQKQLSTEIDEARRQLDDFMVTMAELPKYQEQSQNLAAQKGELNSSLYAKDEILDLFDRITDDATSHQLTLKGISPPVAELLLLNRALLTDNTPRFLNITVDLQGKYIDFGQYLIGLEAAPYFRQVNACYLRGSPTPQAELDLSISFKALIGAPEDRV